MYVCSLLLRLCSGNILITSWLYYRSSFEDLLLKLCFAACMHICMYVCRSGGAGGKVLPIGATPSQNGILSPHAAEFWFPDRLPHCVFLTAFCDPFIHAHA